MTNNEKHKADVLEVVQKTFFDYNTIDITDKICTLTTQYTADALEWIQSKEIKVNWFKKQDGKWANYGISIEQQVEITTAELVALFGEQEYKPKDVHL